MRHDAINNLGENVLYTIIAETKTTPRQNVNVHNLYGSRRWQWHACEIIIIRENGRKRSGRAAVWRRWRIRVIFYCVSSTPRAELLLNSIAASWRFEKSLRDDITCRHRVCERRLNYDDGTVTATRMCTHERIRVLRRDPGGTQRDIPICR